MNEKCQNCNEPTKHITGHWDGRGENGKHTSGNLYSCHSTTCPEAIEARKLGEEARQRQATVIEENQSNGVDIAGMKVLRQKAEITLRKAAAMLGISAPLYINYEQQREPMPKNLYVVWVNTLAEIAPKDGESNG